VSVFVSFVFAVVVRSLSLSLFLTLSRHRRMARMLRRNITSHMNTFFPSDVAIWVSYLSSFFLLTMYCGSNFDWLLDWFMVVDARMCAIISCTQWISCRPLLRVSSAANAV
jgi:hypothetical protein